MEVIGANTGYGGYRGKQRIGRFQGQTQVSEVIRGKHRLGRFQGKNTG